MKLYRRKPQYATAMPVRRDARDLTEYAVQACDATGAPTTSHLVFLTEDEFASDYESFRVRNRPKPKPKVNHKKRTPKITSVKLSELTDEE